MCCGIIQHKLQVVGASSSYALARKSQLLFGYVDAEDSAGWLNRFGQPEGGRARSTANIDHTFTSLWGCGCNRCFRHFSHKLVNTRLLGDPAPRRITVPERPLCYR